MGKDKPILLDISKAYRAKTLDQWMFAYCQGIQRVLPGLSDKKAIIEFMKWADLEEETFNMDAAATQYTRMKMDFLRCL